MTTLPVFRAESELLSAGMGEQIVLSGPEARHAATVRRLSPGEQLELVDGQGLRVTGSVVSAAGDRIELRVEHSLQEPARTPELLLVQALAKGDRDLQAVETCTELGIDAVIPWQAERSIARLRPERQAKQLAKWDSTLTSAAKQSRRARWPQLREPVTSAALTRLLEQSPGTRWLVLHESASQPLSQLLPEIAADGSCEGIGLIVGPEGGVSDAELERFASAGAQPMLLGPEVLRSSSAGAAAVAVLSSALGRW